MTRVAASRRAVALALLGVALLAAAPARAANATPTPSAGELWQDYPLEQGATATPSPVAARTTAASATPRPQADSTSGWGGKEVAVLLMVVAAAIALVSLCVALLGSR